VFYLNNRIKPHAVLTQGGEQTIKDGYSCLSYNRKWEPVGNDPAEAVRLLMKKRGELLTVANGGTVVQEPEGEAKVAGTLNSAFEAWVLKPNHIEHSTCRTSIENRSSRKSCHYRNMDDEYLTVAEVAAMLNISRDTVRRMFVSEPQARAWGLSRSRATQTR
jgi:predicted transcriptional regulator of viral defense system